MLKSFLLPCLELVILCALPTHSPALLISATLWFRFSISIPIKKVQSIPFTRNYQIAVIIFTIGQYSLVRYSETVFYLAHSYKVARKEASVFLRKTMLQRGELRSLSAYYKFKPTIRFKEIIRQKIFNNT